MPPIFPASLCLRADSYRRWLASLVLVAVIGLSGCGSKSHESGTAEKAPLPTLKAEVLAVEPQPWPTQVRTQGALVADEVATVGAKVAGRVAKVHVDLGDTVKAGEPLVTLDQADFLLKVKQAEALLAQSRSALGLTAGEPVENFVAENAPSVREQKAVWDEAKAKADRYRQLLRQQAVPQIEANQFISAEQVAAARYSAALDGTNEKVAIIHVRESELALAHQELEDSVIVAPFDAMIRERHVAPGSYMNAGQSIATVVRTSSLRYRGMVPEVHAQRMALGQGVQLEIESCEDECTARVSRISPAIDEMSRALLFEVEIDNREGRLRSGLFAEASVILDPNAKALVVPTSAVLEFAGVEKVWKVENGVAKEQIIETGERRGDEVAIRTGLKAGDLILTNASEGRVARIEAINGPPPSGATPASVAAKEIVTPAPVRPTEIVDPIPSTSSGNSGP